MGDLRSERIARTSEISMPKWKSGYAISTREIEPGLRVISTEWEMAHGIKRLHAYVLATDDGQLLLIHGPDRVAVYRELADVFPPGGFTKHLLTHHADAAPACKEKVQAEMSSVRSWPLSPLMKSARTQN
jgi:hypothetical protein